MCRSVCIDGREEGRGKAGVGHCSLDTGVSVTDDGAREHEKTKDSGTRARSLTTGFVQKPQIA